MLPTEPAGGLVEEARPTGVFTDDLEPAVLPRVRQIMSYSIKTLDPLRAILAQGYRCVGTEKEVGLGPTSISR